MWIYNGTQDLNAKSKWPEIVAIAITFTVLMFLTVALRFWIRRQTLYSEDWIILLTAVLSIMYNALTIVETRYGLGLPIKDRPKADYLSYTKFNYASRPFYLWGVAGFKVSLCISYLRLTQRTTDRWYRRFIVAMAIFSFASETAFVFTNLFACLPVAKNLDFRIPGHCISLPGNYFSVSAITILCDVIVFLLPIPLVIKLRLDRPVKIGLVIIFSLGLLTTICSILRLASSWEVLYGDGNSSLFVMYSTLELNIGIITSCLPVLRPLLKRLPQNIRSALSYARRREHSVVPEEHNMTPYQSGGSSNATEALSSSKPSKISDKFTTGESDEDVLVAMPERSYSPDTDGWGRMSVTRTIQIDVESAHDLSEGTMGGTHGVNRWSPRMLR